MGTKTVCTGLVPSGGKHSAFFIPQKDPKHVNDGLAGTKVTTTPSRSNLISESPISIQFR